MDTGDQGLAGPGSGGDAGSAAPTCYRHPERETWLRCTRCERPICPDCMRVASVGQHCLECVREGSRSVRQPRTVFGGRVTSSSPVVTWTIIGINAALFLIQLAYPPITGLLEMWPAAVANGQWWRLITSAFLHSTQLPFHILFNMWALAILGPPLEHLLGRLRFVILYLLSALGGSTLGYLLAPVGFLSLGASGAIFGIFGAVFIVSRRLQLDSRWIVVLLIINLVISFTAPFIDWRGHVGGLVTGMLVASAFAYAPRDARRYIHVAASIGMFVILAALIVFRTQLLVG
jgi:membrane associated rhomboid family serine protease